MCEPSFTYYDINTSDIWDYERYVYLNGKSSDADIQKLKTKLETLIYTTIGTQNQLSQVVVEPFTSLAKYDSGEGKEYFLRSIRDLKAARSLRESITLNYFMINDEFYEYNQHILIDLSNQDFGYWYMLKLRQYDLGLKYASQFLDDSLHRAFLDDYKKFTGVLNLIIKQYNQLLTRRLVRIIHQWMNERSQSDFAKFKQIKEVQNEEQSHKLTEKKSVDIDEKLELNINNSTSKIHDQKPPPYSLYNTFFSKKIKEVRNADFNLTISSFRSFYDALVKEGFLKKEENTSKELLDLFTRKSLGKSKVKWQGTPYELRVFAQVIEATKVCDHLSGNAKWGIVQKCFHVKLRGGSIGPIEKYTSISQSSKTKGDKSDKLKQIVDLLTQINL